MKVYIRADGSPKMGLGHLVRCMALAHMLKKEFQIYFFSKEIPDNISNDIIGQGFSFEKIKFEKDFFSVLNGNEIVVLDHYDLDSDYQKKIKNIGSKLVCIDDLHDKKFYADLIINHSPGIKPENYEAQPYTRFALGPGYALLRPVFLEAAGEKRTLWKIKTLLICFGGSDFKNLTREVLQVIEKYDYFKEIIVVVGSAYPYKDSLHEIVKKDERIRLLNSLSEMEMLSTMREADLAIIPASGILLEVIAVGSIPLICYYADNQRKLFNYFKENRIIPSFDALKFDEGQLLSVINDLIKDHSKFRTISLRDEIKASSKNNLNNFIKLYLGEKNISSN